MQIDIRNNVVDKITEIRFDDPEEKDAAFFADILRHSGGDCNVWIRKSEDKTAILGIKNKDVAYSLIAAINKAIDLGWFE